MRWFDKKLATAKDKIELHDSNNHSCYDLNFKIDYDNKIINVVDHTHSFD